MNSEQLNYGRTFVGVEMAMLTVTDYGFALTLLDKDGGMPGITGKIVNGRMTVDRVYNPDRTF